MFQSHAPLLNRREMLQQAGTLGLAAAGASLIGSRGTAAERLPLERRPLAEPHSLVKISGTARERGRQYGRLFADDIQKFLDEQLFAPFAKGGQMREQMLKYAGLNVKPLRKYTPEVFDELEGMAEGSGLSLEEHVLITLHEEMYHRGILPMVDHCTATAVGPPATNDGKTYVAQSWDWFGDLYGTSQVLLWEREEGESVLSYSYPGLWIGAGMNSAGIALCWTSALSGDIKGPTIGIPSYTLIAHMLYQPSLEAALEEARRVPQAGWFTFVLGDGDGKLLNYEGSPQKSAYEWTEGSLARVYHGTREMTNTPLGEPVQKHPQCRRMIDLIEEAKGNINLDRVGLFYGDHESTICKHFGSLDVMVFRTTDRKLSITRGPGCLAQWQEFGFA